MTDQFVNPEITSDDKLWAALGYPIFPIAIIVLLMEEKKNRAFIKYHAVQALALNAVVIVLGFILAATVILSCISPFVWLVTLWPAYDAYMGHYTVLPVITNFIRNQGWVK